MQTTSITIDVRCRARSEFSSYRVYVDNDLLTERTWIWPPHEMMIKEHIEVNVEPGTHKIILKDCENADNFYFKNVTLNGTRVSAEEKFRSTTFTV